MKAVTILALIVDSRGAELLLFDLNYLVDYGEYYSLRLNTTDSKRRPHNKPVARSTFPHWVKETLLLADVDTKTFQAHSIRGASTSSGFLEGFICQRSDTLFPLIFGRFNFRPGVHICRWLKIKEIKIFLSSSGYIGDNLDNLLTRMW